MAAVAPAPPVTVVSSLVVPNTQMPVEATVVPTAQMPVATPVITTAPVVATNVTSIAAAPNLRTVPPGRPAKQCYDQGYTCAEMLNAGHPIGELRLAGYAPSEFTAAGCTEQQLLQAGFSPDQMAAAGFHRPVMQPVVITSVAPPQEQAPVAHVMSRTAETTPAPDDGDKECGCAIPLACPSQDHWGNREPPYPCCGIGKNWVSCMGCIVTDFCCFLCCFEKGAQKRAERYARQSCRTLG